MAIDPRALDEMPAESLDDIAPKMRDGDLLLCSATDPFSRLISWSTKSPWTHVGFAWRWPEGEGCALRVVAVLDPKQAFRFETGR